MMTRDYVRVTNHLADYGKLFPAESLKRDFKTDSEKYYSVYYYNESHLEHFNKTGSVRGIKDTFTDKVIFDFDQESNPDEARRDALALIDKLKLEYNLDPTKDLEIYYSGNKGFNVMLYLDHRITPKLHESTACALASGLSTFDYSLYDANQILRVPNSKHQKTGLYKIILSYNQLKNLSIDSIKKLAETPTSLKSKSPIIAFPTDKFESFDPEPAEPKSDLRKTVNLETTSDKFVGSTDLPMQMDDPRLRDRPRYWKDYKWSLLQGNFNKKERHSALMVIAATCRGLGYDQELTRFMLISADEKHCVLTGDAHSEDIESNVIPSVFTETWNGGQYSYKSNRWLQDYCVRLGIKVDDNDLDSPTVAIVDTLANFKDFAQNIDELTIKTGIEELDKKVRLTIGMTVGIVAGPGTGKTSLAIQILNEMSNHDQLSVFFSFDMYHNLVIQKIIQKHLNVLADEIFDRFKKNDEAFIAKVEEVLAKEYKNVEFCFKIGMTPADMIEAIKYAEQRTGKKCRVVVVDYNELIQTDLSDATQSSAFGINKMREIAITYNLCNIVLLQPSKATGSPDVEIKSYRSAKGSSTIEQAVSVMLGMSRPGYDPRNPQNDKFMTISCVKTRMGSLFALDLHWDGLRGVVRTLSSYEQSELEELRAEKEMEKEKQDGSWN